MTEHTDRPNSNDRKRLFLQIESPVREIKQITDIMLAYGRSNEETADTFDFLGEKLHDAWQLIRDALVGNDDAEAAQ